MRAARRRRRKVGRRSVRPGVSLVAACGVLASVAGAAELMPSHGYEPASASRARTVPVVRADVVCPEVRSDRDSVTRVDIAASGPVGPRPAAGQEPRGYTVDDDAELVDLGRQVPRLSLSEPGAASLTSGGTAASTATTASATAVVGRAQGGLAAGFSASFVTRTTRGELRGLAGAGCVHPDTDFWFVGSGAVIGQRGRLYLTNPTAAPAVVDVRLFGPSGLIEVPAGRGLTVAPQGQEVVLLDALSPATRRFGVHVRVRQGRIGAALRDHQARGLDPRGIDWVPAAAPPSLRVVVPGVPGGAGERLLQVVVPGDADAIVRLRLLAPDGSFVPAAVDVLEVAAGSVQEFDLTAALAGQEMAIELTSDVPVTAGLLARTAATTGQLEELAYTAAARQLTAAQPGVVAQASAGKPTTTHLTLASPQGAASVRIAPLPPGKGSAHLVMVPDGAQVPFDLTRVSTADSFSVVVVPDRGSKGVFVSRVVEEVGRFGRLLTVAPTAPARFSVPVPEVHADLSAGLRAQACLPACP